MNNWKIGGIFIAVVLLGMGAYKLAQPWLAKNKLFQTSDASGDLTTIRMAGDGYQGYFFLHCEKMQEELARNQLSVDWTDDGGAYAERLEKFANHEYDAIVLPINSYLEHGLKHNYPGVIVACISESKGADAMLGFGEIANVDELNNSSWKFVFTGASPSEFLYDLTRHDFDLDNITDKQVTRVNSSEETFKLAKKAKGSGDKKTFYIMWEPEVSKAINELGMKKVWGSDKFSGYIVDVLVFHRDVVDKKPEIISGFLKQYFRTIEHYSIDPVALQEDIAKSAGISKDAASQMIKGIDWFDIHENAYQQFGIISNGSPTNDKLLSSIIQIRKVLMESGQFTDNPLPDPYLIIKSDFVSTLAQATLAEIGKGDGAGIDFAPLDSAAWFMLKPAGSIRIEQISFRPGTDELDEEGERMVLELGNMLKNNYPNYRIMIKGHTGEGDAQSNMELSRNRAEVVKQYLTAVGGIGSNRIYAYGLGATQPPKQKSGEDYRLYLSRWPRVEFILLINNNL